MSFRHIIPTLALLVALACNSRTPTDPSPNPPPVPPPPVVNNTPPVIGKFTVQGTRQNEPPNFADASEDIPVIVEVTDAESAIGDLKFTWSSDVGTFSGSGPQVTWKAPAQVATPGNVTLNLEVVETFSSAGKTVENKVTGSTTLSLHDSITEVGDMARQFLLDFSDSSIKDVPYIMRNFQPDCYGTAGETMQVANNRADFNIVESRVDQPSTTVRFGGTCPYRNLPGDACAQIRARWLSEAKRDLYTSSGDLYLRAGGRDTQNGVDQVAAYYYKDQKRWRLCDSSWKSDQTFKFIPEGLVP